jgi:hypothetical protein
MGVNGSDLIELKTEAERSHFVRKVLKLFYHELLSTNFLLKSEIIFL